jgi:hypothetical protein
MKKSHGEEAHKGQVAWITNDNQDASVRNFLIRYSGYRS